MSLFWSFRYGAPLDNHNSIRKPRSDGSRQSTCATTPFLVCSCLALFFFCRIRLLSHAIIASTGQSHTSSKQTHHDQTTLESSLSPLNELILLPVSFAHMFSVENFDLTNPHLLLSDTNSPHLVFAPFALLPGVEYLFEAVVKVVRSSDFSDQNDQPSLLQGELQVMQPMPS